MPHGEQQHSFHALAAASSSAPPRAAERAQQGRAPDAFAERLREILARRPPLEAFAREATELLQQLASARAAALLGYDRRREQLVLLAARDLPPEASELLNGRPRGWEIPLRCLRNRRISIVEAAHRNSFVPRALTAVAPDGLTIAALPGYADGRPTLVALLFAAEAKGFPDDQVRQLASAVAAIASGLQDPRLAASAPPHSGPATSSIFGSEPPEATGRSGELRRSLEARERELAEAHRWIAALAERLRLEETEKQNRLARAERDRDNWQGRAASLENQLREKNRQLQELAAEHRRALDAAGKNADQLAAAREQLAQLQAQCRDLAEQKRAADRARDAEAQAHAALEAKLRTALEELAAARHTADAARRTKEESERARAAAEREIDALRQRLREREEALAAALARQAELETALRDARREREEAESQLARILAAEQAPGGDEAGLVIERTAPAAEAAHPAALPPGRERPQPSALRRPGSAPLLLLEDPPLQHEAAAVLAESGWDFVAQPPAELAAAELPAAGAVLLNVAASHGWEALWALCQRASGAPPPVLAYVLTPDLPAGFSFGRCEFGSWPPTAAELSMRLEPLQPNLRRLLIVSADVDETGRLRDALGRARISASVALDGRQACELIGAVRPEAVVVHLSPACPDAGRVLSFLRSAPSRGLPLMLLLENPRAESVRAYLHGLGRSLLRLGNFDFGRLDAELAALLRRAGAKTGHRAAIALAAD